MSTSRALLRCFFCLFLVFFAHRAGTAPKVSGKTQLYAVLAMDCPIAGRTARTIAMKLTALQGAGIQLSVVFPNSPPSDNKKVVLWLREHGLAKISPRYVMRPDIAVLIKSTPSVVLESGKNVLYQGRFSEFDQPSKPGSIYPLLAVNSFFQGQPFLKKTTAVGCPIRIVRRNKHGQKALTLAKVDDTGDDPISWNQTVGSIFERKCASCHSGTGVGPVDLTTYSGLTQMIGKVMLAVNRRVMPPWQASDVGKFHDDPSLTDAEIQALNLWVSRGMPAGKAAQRRLKTTVASGNNTWILGTPSKTFNLDTPYTTPSAGKDHYRCFVFKNVVDRERWFNGISFLPGALQSVHHVSAFIDTSGAAVKLDNADPGAGYTNPTPGNGPGFKDYYVIGGWTPGHKPRRLPSNAGIPIPKGADLVVEVHYHLSGKAEKDNTTTGLYFTDQPIYKRYKVGDVGTYNVHINPKDKNGRAEATDVIAGDLTIYSITPHMHLLGRTMRVTAEKPSGELVVLVDIARWDFRWQPSYRFITPVQLPRGTRIDVVATYDNSSDNPDNPHRPPRKVIWGEGTDEEMCSVFFGYTLDTESLKVNIN